MIPTGRSVAVKVNKRQEILNIALKIFAKKGYYQTSVDEIASESRISKGGFYFYFPSKDDLFVSLIREFGDALVKKVEAEIKGTLSPRARLEAIFDRIFSLFVRYTALARFLLIESANGNKLFEAERQKVFDRLEGLIVSCLREAEKNGEIRMELPPELIARIWAGAVYQLIITSLRKKDMQIIEAHRDKIKEQLISSLYTQGGQK